MKDFNFLKDFGSFTSVKEVKDFDSIKIGLASPEKIEEWSFGEVKKPETINYRTFKPERDGLFCERIFGPTKDWECNCGKYKKIKHKDVKCDRCGVDVTLSKVRRERMGHIQLAAPVSHIWFFKSLPSRIGYLLDIPQKNLEKVLYYEIYIVVDPGETPLQKRQLLEDKEYRAATEQYKDNKGKLRFKARMGAEAIRDLLKEINIEVLSQELRDALKTTISTQKKKDIVKRLKVVESFRKSGNRPEWMILERVPVIPPELRPLVPLEGGRFATSDLNDLYRRVINRNNRLKRLLELKAPDVIVRNEKRMLQESVDTLLDNGRRGKPVKGTGNRPLKSLSDMLKGKEGRFRQNLLGKRVDYSGRSVIVVGPELKLHQCGVPKLMAKELFMPFIIKKLEDRGYVHTIKSAKKMVENQRPEVWEVLEEIIREHPVLLNRAPTLHRQGIQAFEPVLIEGKAIRIHPLVCKAYNADFDGDQMAIHVPLSAEAQLEARVLMLSTNNINSLANGSPIVSPTQDIVLGCYYMTKERKVRVFPTSAELRTAYEKGEIGIHQVKTKEIEKKLSASEEIEVSYESSDLAAQKVKRDRSNFDEVIAAYKSGAIGFHLVTKIFTNFDEVEMAYENGEIGLHDKIKVPVNGELKETTTGRIIFYKSLPQVDDDKSRRVQIPFEMVNKVLANKELSNLVAYSYAALGQEKTVLLLDTIKEIGFQYANQAGITVSIDDMKIPEMKKEIVTKAKKDVMEIERQYQNGVITNGERYNKVIDIWTHATDQIGDVMFTELSKDQKGFNPIFMMADSGARGSKLQIRQLAGMRGLMAKPQQKITGEIGEIIESPIIANFREGLTVLEYFISTHGARKGLADTALKTAEAGYLTRRLVDVAQDAIVNEEDCGTMEGIPVSAVKEGTEVIQSLHDRIVGRIALQNVVDPTTDKPIVRANEEITEEVASKIEEQGLEYIKIRSVLTCEAKRGICAKCYGRNLANGGVVDLGEAVGVIAAQSIGEPGTQLTLRTFHVGGTASRVLEQTKIVAKSTGTLRFPKDLKTIKDSHGNTLVLNRNAEISIYDESGHQRETYRIGYGTKLLKNNGDSVRKGDIKGDFKGDVIATWDIYNDSIFSESVGTVEFRDILEGITMSEEIDHTTGLIGRVIIDTQEMIKGPDGEEHHPHPLIIIKDDMGKELGRYHIPTGAHLMVNDNNRVEIGDVLAKKPREISKTRDITGGLPRVAELFEARKPKFAAIISEIQGEVKFGAPTKGMRKVIITNPEATKDNVKEYLIPYGRHLNVREGDFVEVGEQLTDGPINPHDMLKVKGVGAVQEYLVNKIQEVYRLQGVKINDKHIEVIVRQMLKKVRVEDPGDTDYLVGQQVNKVDFLKENEKMQEQGKQVAQASPILLGITKASLGTDSFISAASFQETTRVLTEAAISGKVDDLRGLKENVIMGHLIPAGTGMQYYRDIQIEDMGETFQEEKDPEIIINIDSKEVNI